MREIVGRTRRGHLGQLRQAEVQHLGVALSGDEDVLRFQIPVDDPGGMCCCQSLGDLGGQTERLLERQRTLSQRFPERVALQVLLHHEVGAVFDAYVMNGCDVRVVQSSGSSCLLLEAGEALGARGELGGQHLDGHLAAQARVLGEIHLAHAARAEQLGDLVGA